MKNAYGSVTSAGLDVHYKFSNVTMRDAEQRIVRRERLEHSDRPALVQRMSGWPKGLAVVMESSFGWSWLSDVAEQLGLEPHLSNCFKVEQYRKANGWAKTNKKDADLVSLLIYEKRRWWEVWRAPAEVRDRREVMRHRSCLVDLQTGTKNRIHAIFHRHGIFHEHADLFGGQGRQFLAGLCKDGRFKDGQLDEGALLGLRGQVRLLDHLRKELAAITRQLRGQLKRTPLVDRLDSIPGIGIILAHVFIAEIGQLERFGGNHRRLANYSLLAPQAEDTGEPDPSVDPKGRHLGHRGNHTLKWAFIEAAHGAVRRDPYYRSMFNAYTDNGKKNRNRGYIKVARELVKAVVGVWKHQTVYSRQPPARPGSQGPQSDARRAGGQTSRSGTGQLSVAMVTASNGR